MPAAQLIFQTLRRVRVLIWRTTYRAYCNAHAGTKIPANARIATTAKLELETRGSVVLGNNCQLTHYCVISPYGGRVELGDRVYIGHYSVIYGHGGVTIGQDTLIAAQVTIVAMSHGFADPDLPISQQPVSTQGIKIGRDCWIGEGVTILDGIELGDGCVIGAGAVVNRSMPAGSIAVGVPARVVGRRGGPDAAILKQFASSPQPDPGGSLP